MFGRMLCRSMFTSFYSHLDRGVVSVRGEDVGKFLHGLVTSNINALNSADGPVGQFSCFLNHAGRVLFDVFIWRGNGEGDDERRLLIECQRPYVSDILVHLNIYKVRSRVTIEDVSDDYQAFAAEEPLEHFEDRKNDKILSIRDTRSSKWSLSRYLLKSNCNHAELFSNLQPATRHEYRATRMFFGVPEGFVEIKSGTAIPFDYNIDLMNGIEFNKGCYTGQELITRTRHQGMVRKRCHPVRLFDPDTQSIESFAFDPDFSHKMAVVPDSELMGATVKGTATNITDYTAQYAIKMGRMVRTVGNLGIAIIREENLTHSKYAALFSERPAMVLCEIN